MKSKLTPELQKEIIKNVKKGFYIKKSAMAAGINESTYYRWVQRGTKVLLLKKNGKEIPESEIIYYNFCNSVRQAGEEPFYTFYTL